MKKLTDLLSTRLPIWFSLAVLLAGCALAIAEPPDGQAAPTAASYEGAPSGTTAELVNLHVDPAGLTLDK